MTKCNRHTEPLRESSRERTNAVAWVVGSSGHGGIQPARFRRGLGERAVAGTYTPFTLGVLRGAWGWTLFTLVWALAVIGVILKVVRGVRYPTLSLLMYLAMGWLGVIAIRPLWLGVPLSGLVWLLLGGVAYTMGAAFFTAERLDYGHFVWHVFVLAGTSCHFVAVCFYAA